MDNTTELYAQPYDISAIGFYFQTIEEYHTKSTKLCNAYGDPVEEFEIQFINGDSIDSELFSSLSVNQCNFKAFLEVCEIWEEYQKINVIIAVGESGYDFDLQQDSPDDFDIELYEINSLKELAEQFIDEGFFGEIPENIQCYLDYDAIARDLSMDYTQTTIVNTNLIYRCG